MKVHKFIDKLRRYSDFKLPDDYKDILKDLESRIDEAAVLTSENLHKWIPNWKDLSSIEISFTYQPNFDGLYIYTKTIAKDGTEVNDYDKFVYDSPFATRMKLIITNDNVYDKKYVKDCFSKELLAAFKKNKVKLVIGNCDRGDDT